jgi:hypothetical protein
MSAELSNSGSRKTMLLLGLYALAVLILAAVLQTGPGYMDAEYYYSGGLQLVQGKGFNEPFLWNYLDQPAGLPHPSFTYWMPLASIIAFVGMKLAGASTFLAARWPFILLASLIPGLTYSLSIKIGARPATAKLAGWLAVFPGFYLVFTSLTETFVLYMLGGTLFFLLVSIEDQPWNMPGRWLRYGLLGLVAGWMHAARADGLMWLGMAGLVWLVETLGAWRTRKAKIWQVAVDLFLLILGYSLVMGPWYARNLSLYGTPFSPGGARTLWLTDYDQTYRLQVETLTVQNWLAAGFPAILKVRWDALVLNLKNMLAVQGSVFLLPFMLFGIWEKRKATVIRFGVLGWLITLFAMTVVFPFSGSRGGFLHSGVAFQPFLWACAALGFEKTIEWSAAKRGWSRKGAWRAFAGGAVVLSALFTFGIFGMRVLAQDWDASQRAYQAVAVELDALDISEEDVFLVNNPPGFYLATGRPSIVIPDGDEENVLAAAQRYAADYLLLDANNPKLDPLFQAENCVTGFDLLVDIETMKLYKIELQP